MVRSGIASFPLWKAVLGGIYLSAFFTGMIWLFNSLYLANWKHPLSFSELTLGCIVLPLYLWTWWALKNKGGNSWCGWLSNLSLGVYLSFLLLVGAVMFYNRALSSPWNWLAIGLEIGLVLGGFILFLAAPNTFEHLFFGRMNRFSQLLIFLLGGSGTGGAAIGMYSARHGGLDFLQFLMAIMFGFLGKVFLFGSLYFSWHSRPWAKKDE